MKRILCFGDSNTWGAKPASAERLGYGERWPGILQRRLGEGYAIIEEGLPGRTTVWDDPIEEHKNGKAYLYPCLDSHAPLDMVVLMLGTNDLKPRFSLTAFDIAAGAERLVKVINAHKPEFVRVPAKVLLICPAPVLPGIDDTELSGMFDYEHSHRVSLMLPTAFEKIAKLHDCLYLDAGKHAEVSELDCVHFTQEGHGALAEAVANVITGHFA